MIDSKKVSTLLTLLVLLEYTDENHYITYPDIIGHINNKYSIELGRKCIADNVQLLDELGYDINHGTRKGVAIFDRGITKTEVEVILRILQFNHYFTNNQFQTIFKWLTKTFSIYQTKELKERIPRSNYNPNKNQTMFLNVELILEAIKDQKRIAFNIKENSSEKNHRAVELLPTNITSDGDDMVLVSENHNGKDIHIFHIDDIRDLVILKDNPDIDPKEIIIDKSLNEIQVIKRRVFIYDPKVIEAVIEINDAIYYTEFKELYKNDILLTNQLNESTWEVKLKVNESKMVDTIIAQPEYIIAKEPDSLINKLKSIYSSLKRYY